MSQDNDDPCVDDVALQSIAMSVDMNLKIQVPKPIEFLVIVQDEGAELEDKARMTGNMCCIAHSIELLQKTLISLEAQAEAMALQEGNTGESIH